MNAHVSPVGAAATRPPVAAPLGAGELGDVTLPLGPGLPGAARSVVTGWLGDRASPVVLGDVLLLVSELMTNSYRHAGETLGASVRLRGRAHDRTVWFEVGDGGRSGAVVRRTPAGDGHGGYGLHLVEMLACAWGVTHVDGTEVWFTLELPAAEAA